MIRLCSLTKDHSADYECGRYFVKEREERKRKRKREI